MSAREIQDQKAIAHEMVVQQSAHANAEVSASPLRGIRFAPSRVDVITHSELAVFNARFYIRVRSFDEPS